MLDKKAVLHIASLSKLELSPAEVETYSHQMNAIVGYFEQLSKIDTKSVEPLISPSDIVQHIREDVVHTQHMIDGMIKNAPDASGNLFKVPPVV